MPIEHLLLLPLHTAGTEIQVVPAQSTSAQFIFEKLRNSFDRRSNLQHGTLADAAHPVADLIKNLPRHSEREELLKSLAQQIKVTWQPLLEQAEIKPSAIILALYRDAVSLHLMIAVAAEQPVLLLTAQGEPTFKQQLDLEHPQQAVKVNLTALQMEQEGHLCFIGPKAKADDEHSISRLTGCSETIAAKEATHDLIKAAADYCETHQLGSRTAEAMDQVVDYMQQQKKEREPVALEDVSRLFEVYIPPEQAETHAGAFGTFAKQGPYRLSDQFQPHNLTLNRIGRLQARTGSWKLELAQQALGLINSQQDVLFDPENGRLILKNLPPALRQQLSAATGVDYSE